MISDKYGFTREELDKFGMWSHQKATIAMRNEEEYFKRVVPVTYQKKGIDEQGKSIKDESTGKQIVEEVTISKDQTVREMAEGIRRSAKTDMGLAVTGIAGPLGGSETKPVGTVFIGLSAQSSLFSGQYRFPGDRQSVKVATAEMALDWVRRYLHGHPFIPGI